MMSHWKLFSIFILISLSYKCVYGIFGGTDRQILNTVGLYFYSPHHDAEQLLGQNKKLKNFVPDFPTKVIVHGYIADRNQLSIEPLKNAYLARGNVNLIIVDWLDGAFQLYDRSRFLVPYVGIQAGKILKEFVKTEGVSLDSIHVLGHSLGAHIAGNIGRYFEGNLGRVTGLDPALPLFEKDSPDAIRKTDAKFVDCMHTCVNILGDGWSRGHADFFPNSGYPSQPGCNLIDLGSVFACSHYRAPIFFAESIVSPQSFPSTACPLDDILQSVSANKCRSNGNDVVFMGENLSSSARGNFYLVTNGVVPFGKGNWSDNVNNI